LERFSLGDELLFVRAQKDAKNNERERRRSHSRSLDALSLFFCARKSRDGSSFPSTSYSSSLFVVVFSEGNN